MLSTLALLATLAQAPAPVPTAQPFLDVPPCSYAAGAVARTAQLGIFQGSPATSSELARNAVRQVFEGLKCGDIAWTTRFIAELPQGYATGIPQLGAALKPGFDFEVLGLQMEGQSAEVRFRLAYRGQGRRMERTATVQLVPDAQTGWRVLFGSLHESGLPFF
ncbi:hypothetical protein [Deinococcus ruber]|uniref:Uncharacterized protein n=1 Tax=Deinococcus ruber TaxID=1848197 RepID=A0A918FGH9_9DEIO|nr:hypothetical protein [Deinococcus ruber]GGR36350.1 hypothetical protein GCM10008957_52610 [Deinococcus ruber]